MNMNPVKQQISKYKKVLADDVWSKTPLLKIFSDRLGGMLERLEAVYAESNDEAKYVSVYVLLYHQQGKLTIWEDMIKKIQFSVERRPVYLSFNEAKLAIQDENREGVVILDIEKQSILGSEGLRYLKVANVKLQNVKGLYWNRKLFHFNELSLIEMNSELTD